MSNSVPLREGQVIRKYLIDLCTQALNANPQSSVEDVYRSVMPVCNDAYRGASGYPVYPEHERRMGRIRQHFNTCLANAGLNAIDDNYGRRKDIHDTAERRICKSSKQTRALRSSLGPGLFEDTYEGGRSKDRQAS